MEKTVRKSMNKWTREAEKREYEEKKGETTKPEINEGIWNEEKELEKEKQK